MSERIPVNPGEVEWCGDNPGIYLKQSPDANWSALGIFFRIVLSPHGRGHTMIILDAPDESTGFPDSHNLCLSDNAPLTEYLLTEFVSRFPAFKGKRGLQGMTHLALDSICSAGDMKADYKEIAVSGDIEAVMHWHTLQEPFAVEVSPADSATARHDMYSVFLEATSAHLSVNGVRLAGEVVTRPFFGRTMSTAFLALSETWVTPGRPVD